MSPTATLKRPRSPQTAPPFEPPSKSTSSPSIRETAVFSPQLLDGSWDSAVSVQGASYTAAAAASHNPYSRRSIASAGSSYQSASPAEAMQTPATEVSPTYVTPQNYQSIVDEIMSQSRKGSDFGLELRDFEMMDTLGEFR